MPSRALLTQPTTCHNGTPWTIGEHVHLLVTTFDHYPYPLHSHQCEKRSSRHRRYPKVCSFVGAASQQTPRHTSHTAELQWLHKTSCSESRHLPGANQHTTSSNRAPIIMRFVDHGNLTAQLCNIHSYRTCVTSYLRTVIDQSTRQRSMANTRFQ